MAVLTRTANLVKLKYSNFSAIQYVATKTAEGHSRSQVKVTESNIPVVLVPSPVQVLVAEPTTPNPVSQVTVATVPNGLLSVVPVL